MNKEITNVNEFEEIAKEKLPKMVYDYFSSGAEDQWTLQENRMAFSRILFRPRILIDVSKIDMATTFLSHKISMPIMLAPSAMQKMAHPDGELAVARAASAADALMVLSSWSTCSLEEVASTGPGTRLQQVYVYKDRNIVWQLVKRAEKAGYKGFVVTVDTPILGRREVDIKNRFSLPPHLTLKNFAHLNLGTMEKAADSGLAAYVASQVDRSLSWKGSLLDAKSQLWFLGSEYLDMRFFLTSINCILWRIRRKFQLDDVKWLQSITSLPVILKGVNTAEDAKLAVENGAAAIIVSNHGARQLDYSPATINCLEEVVKATNGRIPVYLDGGVRRGTDVFKALALGASGVFVGRPVLYSLAADGEAGVRKMLQILHDEFQLAMALSGCTSLREITRNHVIMEGDAKHAMSRL